MPKLSETARARKDRPEDQLKAAFDIDVPIASSYWRDQFSVQPSLKTINNFDQMMMALRTEP